MAQEPDETTRRVVKKVVKKTVVRPLPQNRPASVPASTNGQSAPTAPIGAPVRRSRITRLATPARAKPVPVTSVPPTSTAPPAAVRPPAPAPRMAEPPAPVLPPPVLPPTESAVEPHTELTPKPAKIRRSFSLPALPKFRKARTRKPKAGGRLPDVGGVLSNIRYAITDRIHDGFLAIVDGIADGWHWLIRLRPPHLSPTRGSAITGILVGLLSVLFGWGFYLLFSATRGTSAGGGWGFLAIVFTAFVAFIAGELLLSGFGVPLARVISILSILLALLVVLVFFVKLVAGVWAWLIIPTITSLSFIASSAVMRIASQEKNEQRLPWEPTKESQVNLD